MIIVIKDGFLCEQPASLTQPELLGVSGEEMTEASVSFLLPSGWPTFKRRGFAFRIMRLDRGIT
ncbi:TPA: hypothetical protein ACIYCI_004544 [Escherichia coli]|jgi:hypothetical protein|uniref:Uncharacterized protein n=1 Tax=Escherichia coli TaxID=562 RepID=A0A895NUE8_ECOLX|nr:hypothetical protein [Escherichia coli]QRZ96649.1 hypothetical protein JNP96_23035 [Escherichia coli]